MILNINKLRLKWKIFAFIIGFCALLLLILWLFQITFLDSFYQTIKTREIKEAASSLTDNINNKDLSGLIANISQNGEVYIEVCTLDGTALLTSSNTKYKVSLADKQAMLLEAGRNNSEALKYIMPMPPEKPSEAGKFVGDLPPGNFQQEQQLAYIKLVKNESAQTVGILVNTVITPVNATVNTLRYQLYVVTVIMFLLSVVLALVIAKRISRPIEEINKSAKVLAGGNYNTHFDAKGFLEIGELSDTLNSTAAELNTVEALRRELLANVSHDLRTPLSLIYSYAEMIHDFPDEVTPEQTQIIMDETKRLSILVNDLLDISKFESGTQQLGLSEFNITKSARDTVERIHELVKINGYCLSFEYDREILVNADETRITQALYNLLINAVNYTGSDKKVTVRQSISDKYVRLEVSDTGDGIPAENIPYIWDRYYKVDKKHKRAVMGTGLGLSIVKKVMELHGGKYGVESRVGIGSTFWFEVGI